VPVLKSIEKTGSLNQGALEMGMSYRKAWNVLRDIEDRLGFALIERKQVARQAAVQPSPPWENFA